MSIQLHSKSKEAYGQLFLATIFFLTRFAVLHAGIGPHADFLLLDWTNLDPQLMHDDLPKSLLYLHSQPPLWNIAIALLIKIAGGVNGKVEWIWTAIAWAMSLAIAFIIQHLVYRLTFKGMIATGAGAFWILFSSGYYWESTIHYALPTAFLATLALFCTYKSAVSSLLARKLVWFALMLTSVLGLTLTWPLFHPLVVALVAGAMLISLGISHMVKPWRDRFMITASLLILLALVVPLKNKILYGHFYSSSWIGVNLGGMAEVAVPKETPSQCDFNTPFTKEENDLGMANTDPNVAAHPVNANRYKMFKIGAKKSLNYNNIGIIGRSEKCLDLFKQTLTMQPVPFLTNRLDNAIDTTTRLSDDYWNRNGGLGEASIIQARNSIYLRIPKMSRYSYAWISGRNYLLPALAHLALVVYLPLQWWQLRRRNQLPQGWTGVLAITLLLVLWVVVMGNLANYAEQQRFRFTVEPLMLIALSVGLGLALPHDRPARPAQPGRTAPPLP